MINKIRIKILMIKILIQKLSRLEILMKINLFSRILIMKSKTSFNQP